MKKISKEDVVRVIAELKTKGYSPEKLAVMLNKTHQTIWRWSSIATNSVPDKANYEILKRLTVK